MSYILRSSTVIRRAWFSGVVTGTPTAQLYVSGIASGSPMVGTGADDEWVFSVPVGALAFGTSVEIWAFGLVGAVTERVKLVDGFIADTVEDVGSGDATLVKQDEILAALQASRVLTVASPNVKGDLVLVQGDTYDGIGNPKAQWVVTTDYTVGWAVAFTIRDENDAVIYTTTGTVASATLVTVDIDAPTGLPMCNSPRVWKGKFDVELTKGVEPNRSVKTIALGDVYISEDVTRE